MEIIETLVPDAAPMLRNPNFELLVVTVTVVEDDGATNEVPPRLKIKIDEVLRGDRETGEADAVWEPAVRAGDLVDPNSPDSGIKDSWRTQRLAGPEVGDRLIVFAIERASPPTIHIQTGSVFRFSVANRDLARQSMATERSSGIQLVLLVAVLALCLGSLVLFVRSRAAAVSPQGRRRLHGLVLVAGGLAFVIYGLYESGISRYSNIRIDMLVLVPALAVALVLGVVSTVHLLLRRKKSE